MPFLNQVIYRVDVVKTKKATKYFLIVAFYGLFCNRIFISDQNGRGSLLYSMLQQNR